ncbi:MAG: hypothetical protein EU550_02775 [Promethearchaeota archaeon]|nr:MAG: hypothetical protein EU550_02775 [Candidatus Lokiarchaeota archaeon]
MDFFLKNLRETLEAINKLIDNNINIVNTKRVRRCNKVKSSNRSKINFIWRSLSFLEDEGILKMNGISNPKTYVIPRNEKIDIEEFIEKIKDKR